MLCYVVVYSSKCYIALLYELCHLLLDVNIVWLSLVAIIHVLLTKSRKNTDHTENSLEALYWSAVIFVMGGHVAIPM